jgi:hypothetical protein
MLNPELSPSIPNPNHPKLGDTIKVEPIRTVNAINQIKKALAPSPRNFAIFVSDEGPDLYFSLLVSVSSDAFR